MSSITHMSHSPTCELCKVDGSNLIAVVYTPDNNSPEDNHIYLHPECLSHSTFVGPYEVIDNLAQALIVNDGPIESMEDRDEAVIAHAGQGNLEKIISVLAMGAISSEGRGNAIMEAAWFGHNHIVSHLLSSGEPICDYARVTAMEYATNTANLDLALMLTADSDNDSVE